MLSQTARALTYLTAALFALIGSILFLLPDWSAASFGWAISPFVAMTMGGWYLGSGVVAFHAARLWRWSVTHPILIFIWAFSLAEGLLLLVHRDVLRFDGALALPYAGMLLVAAVSAVAGIASYWRERPAIEPEGLPHAGWSRMMWGLFVLYVSLLVLVLVDGIAPDGRVWPGPLSLLTARAFAAFFGSLVLGALPLIRARGFAPVEAYARPGLFLAAIIEVGALFYLHLFDFAAHPGGLLYHGSYGIAIGGALLIIGYTTWKRRAARPAMAAPGGAL